VKKRYRGDQSDRFKETRFHQARREREMKNHVPPEMYFRIR
jgi:hypothetical protein